jgi:UDP-N-acetylmuramoyl-L-alanyl-D-glutamate--2,6-diaminopimelate ligase
MDLNTLIKKTGFQVLHRSGEGNPEIYDCVGDSRMVTDGALFVAISGTKMNGGSFIAEATARGAKAVVSEEIPGADCSAIPWIRVSNTRHVLGMIGKTLYGVDVDAMETIGITGTNGKTTTAHLFKKLCEQRFSPAEVWMFGTIDYQLGTENRTASHTTPESHEIFRLIGRAGKRPRAVVMEVSSHALALDRVGGMEYDVALLTNVTQDHLDFHETMEAYYQAKKRLFADYLKANGTGVVNIDDSWGRRLAGEFNGKKLITFGVSPDAAVRIVKHECSWDGSIVTLSAEGGQVEFRSVLRGFFNVYNMTALYAGSLALGYDVASVERAFAAVETVPGRMDRVAIDADFAVVVDYAHTPDALVNILQTARPLTKGKLICVFGCGGDRDRTKRPIMGNAVASFADEAIVTSDNPRSEKPMAIIEEIIKGIPLDFPHIIESDRRSAIKKALAAARTGDCVVIAGKGHENYQEIQGVREPFNDKDVVIESFHG